MVALDRGTDKALWAVSNGRHLVHPLWLEACMLTWRRENEGSFQVPSGGGKAGWQSAMQSVSVVPTVDVPGRVGILDGKGDARPAGVVE